MVLGKGSLPPAHMNRFAAIDKIIIWAILMLLTTYSCFRRVSALTERNKC